ncbi:hypothetical protein M093_1920 [Bacteroides uniformis str. 3978 T3 i]|jgi:hypothetical protein|nr:hypothetical protein HMPREF0619_04326 [Parabacteroides sp. D13]KDS61590.1 hypothetical protein M093_1920 [Bacteroides uniformis str. 3978 T3 i]
MEKQMRNRRFHSTGKGSPPPYRQGKVMPQAVFGKIILAGGSGIFPKNPALPGCGLFGACGMKSPVPNHKL